MAPRTRRSMSRMRILEAKCVDAEAQTSSLGSSPLYKAAAMLFQTKKGANVTFILDQKEIHAHKSFLIGRSTVFEAMFIGPMASNDPHPIISLNNYVANASEFETFLEYLYTDQSDINLQNVYAIFKLAHMYDISSLLEECAAFLQYNIQLSNVLDIATFSYLYQECCSLFKAALEFICRNAMKVLNLTEFNNLEATVVAEILKCDNLKAQESELFDIIYGWSIEEAKRHGLDITNRNLRSVSVTVTDHLRFPLMDPMFLASHVKATKFLSSSDFSDALCDSVLISNGLSEQCTSRFSIKPRVAASRKRKNRDNLEYNREFLF